MNLLRAVPLIVLALVLFASPAHAQTRADTVQTELVRLRGFIRAAETQATKALDLLAPLTTQPSAPPTVMDWRTGLWSINAGGYAVALDLDRSTATSQGVTAPIVAQAVGDTLRVRLKVTGYESGLLELVHAEGRMVGTVTRDTTVRPAAGERAARGVVQTVRRTPCTFALFTDGSWGVTPNTAACHQALDLYLSPVRLRYTAREYVP